MELVAQRTSLLFVFVPLCKFRDFSELFVADVVEDQADLIVGLEEAADHPGIVEDLGSPFD